MTDLVTHSNKRPIIYNGHLCEGATLVGDYPDTFCLWTRCGSQDVPANSAHEGGANEVTCLACRAIVARAES